MASNTTTSESCDVVVIGGGPAGATIATFLQRQRHHCMVLESSTFPRYHVGESLIPHTYGTLDRLGLLAKLRNSDFPPNTASASSLLHRRSVQSPGRKW